MSQLVSYSHLNYANDASIEDIVAPSSDKNYYRDNPACSNPVIKVKNTGANVIASMVFEYGISGLTLSTYTWTGLMQPLETLDIVFPPSTAVMAHSVTVQFEARIVSVNNMDDDYADNDYYYSFTKPVK